MSIIKTGDSVVLGGTCKRCGKALEYPTVVLINTFYKTPCLRMGEASAKEWHKALSASRQHCSNCKAEIRANVLTKLKSIPSKIFFSTMKLKKK